MDNIAGITKFDDDISQAEGKRKETEENLERIRIILDEIDKQIKQLEADRDGALKYRDLNEAAVEKTRALGIPAEVKDLDTDPSHPVRLRSLRESPRAPSPTACRVNGAGGEGPTSDDCNNPQ